jgi:hypothetical protein
VTDTLGNPVVLGTIGTFTVAVPTAHATPAPSVPAAVNGTASTNSATVVMTAVQAANSPMGPHGVVPAIRAAAGSSPLSSSAASNADYFFALLGAGNEKDLASIMAGV